ncbi:hypothetical protein NCCP2222_01700 [Sporosarcina sp. NCCP-2222]|uniref:hypothetical protein n=1 Tax=Sporosarcina sp. NCCP-2222 TaxID=2935073 RepID=UPI002082B7EF|nr:hypothetical protein [Sporosarcina sp. NCCP-2222]GKV54223.1 hypothetical protein NCCP2222_01700 [Sporosarcina sp. NCCP-2222]
MDKKDLATTKSQLSIQVIRDILIDNGLVTYHEFQERLLKKVQTSPLSEKDKQTLRENI